MKQDRSRSRAWGVSVLSCVFCMAVLLAALITRVSLAGAETVFEGALYVDEEPRFYAIPGTIDGKSSYAIRSADAIHTELLNVIPVYLKSATDRPIINNSRLSDYLNIETQLKDEEKILRYIKYNSNENIIKHQKSSYQRYSIKGGTYCYSMSEDGVIEEAKLTIDGQLELPSGTYYLTGLELKNNSTLTVSGPVKILCTSNVILGENAQIIGYQNQAKNFSLCCYRIGTVIEMKKNCRFIGTILAPECRLIFSAGDYLIGGIIVGSFEIKYGSYGYSDGPWLIEYDESLATGDSTSASSVSASSSVYASLATGDSTSASSVYASSSLCLESDSGSLDIEGVKVRAGKEVRVPVRIQHAPNQVTAFGFEVTYPAQVMEFLSFEPGDLAGPSTAFEVTSVAPARLSVTGVSSEDAIPKGANGCLVWLNFKTKNNSQVQEIEPASLGNEPKGVGTEPASLGTKPASLGNEPKGVGTKPASLGNEPKGVVQGVEQAVGQAVGQGVGIPNPASVYCINNGGKLEIREDAEGNQYGVCLFSDGIECEEWAYFRGECNPVQKNQCYSLRLENLKDDLARFSASQGCLCLYNCQTEGDLNGDGNLTPEDALIAFRCYLKSGPCFDCADVNEDGSVTPGDALCIFESYLGKSSCLDHQPGAAPAPIQMEGEWQSQNLTSGGKLAIDREKKIVEMLGSPYALGQGSLLNFQYTPTGGSSPISFQAEFAGGSYTACFTGTASNSLCPPGVWCFWAGRFSVDGQYSLKGSLGQLLDEGTFSIKYPVYP